MCEKELWFLILMDFLKANSGKPNFVMNAKSVGEREWSISREDEFRTTTRGCLGGGQALGFY